MIRYVDLQFFKGGTSVQEVDKREPKSDQLKAMDDAMYNVMGGLTQRYGGYTMPTINSYTPSTTTASAGSTTGSGTSNTNNKSDNAVTSIGKPTGENSNVAGGTGYNNNVAGGTGYNNSGWGEGGYLDSAFDKADTLSELANRNSFNLLNEVPAYLTKADSTLDEAQKYAVQGQQKASKYYDDADYYLGEHKGLLANGTNEGLTNYMSSIYDSINRNYVNSASKLIDDAAARGIVNTSTSSRALNGLSSASANAAADQYAGGFNTYLQNYLGGAEQSRGLAESSLNTADRSSANLVNIANGYRGNYDSGLSGLKTYADLPSTYYGNAMAPLTPAYNFWNQSTQNWLANDKDYVATSSGK